MTNSVRLDSLDRYNSTSPVPAAAAGRLKDLAVVTKASKPEIMGALLLTIGVEDEEKFKAGIRAYRELTRGTPTERHHLKWPTPVFSRAVALVYMGRQVMVERYELIGSSLLAAPESPKTMTALIERYNALDVAQFDPEAAAPPIDLTSLT